MGLKEQISSGSPSTLRAGTGFVPSSPGSSLSTLSPLKFFDRSNISKSTSAQNPFSADTLDKARCAIIRYNLLRPVWPALISSSPRTSRLHIRPHGPANLPYLLSCTARAGIPQVRGAGFRSEDQPRLSSRRLGSGLNLPIRL